MAVISIQLWEKIRQSIPEEDFLFRHRMKKYVPGNHNGASDPFLYLIWWLLSRHTRYLIRENSYVHDFGFVFGHLPGAPFAHLTRDEWNELYVLFYMEHKMRFISRYSDWGLEKFSHRSWRRNDRQMKEWGFETYQDWEGSKRAA